MNPSLTEFLLARIAEDERAARAAGTASSGALAVALLPEPTRLHVMTWAPNRVLAECEAKRRIVTLISSPGMQTLRLLALPYEDHPDYQPEWTP